MYMTVDMNISLESCMQAHHMSMYTNLGARWVGLDSIYWGLVVIF